jgi:hypothetical protein
MALARVFSGRTVASQRASLDVPTPGGPALGVISRVVVCGREASLLNSCYAAITRGSGAGFFLHAAYAGAAVDRLDLEVSASAIDSPST